MADADVVKVEIELGCGPAHTISRTASAGRGTPEPDDLRAPFMRPVHLLTWTESAI
jgi:hypothetical protein